MREEISQQVWQYLGHHEEKGCLEWAAWCSGRNPKEIDTARERTLDLSEKQPGRGPKYLFRRKSV